MTQQQYIANWHDSFVAYIVGMKGIIDGLMLSPMATENDKNGLSLCKSILDSQDVKVVEDSLAKGVVSKDLIQKIEKLDKDFVNTIIDHIQTNAIVKEFWRLLAYLRIDQEMKGAVDRLSMLGIKIEGLAFSN